MIITTVFSLAILGALAIVAYKLREVAHMVYNEKKARIRAQKNINNVYRVQLAQAESTLPVPHERLIHPEEYDYHTAPISGMIRETWILVGKRLLENTLAHSNGMTDRLRFPDSMAAGYPRLLLYGEIYGQRHEYLESYARTLFLASSLLSIEPDLRVQDRSVKEYYLEYLLRGCDRYDSASFGWETSGEPSQILVEAATICICLSEARKVLWEALSSREQEKVYRWLDQYKDIVPYHSNWNWFTVIINTFLKKEGQAYNSELLADCISRIRSLYRDAGWYLDGTRFDYYSAWAFQIHSLFWMLWDGESNPDFQEEVNVFNDRFLESYSHLFSREGHMPVWGRSVCYRFAASSPLSMAFKRPRTPAMDPGFARYLCSANLNQFVSHPEFLKNGIPSLGFYGENPELIDEYSCVASPFLSTQLFLALTLPENHAFWTAEENIGFWTSPPSRYEFGSTGLWVEHDADTGHSRLHTPELSPSDKYAQDPRYSNRVFDTIDTVFKN